MKRKYKILTTYVVIKNWKRILVVFNHVLLTKKVDNLLVEATRAKFPTSNVKIFGMPRTRKYPSAVHQMEH